MKAVRVHQYGDLDGLRYEDAPKPAPGPGEVLVKVHAAGVNPFDWYMVEGFVRDFVEVRFPAVVGRDLSGMVEAVGSGAGEFAVGDAVYGSADAAKDGSFADYVAVAVDRLAPKPERLDHVAAASLPNALLAAWDGLFSTATGMNLQPGQTVLIHGAAGGIGSLAVQLAKHRGARVIGTSSAGNSDFLRELGAADVLDYASPGFLDGVGPLDGVLDTACAEPENLSYALLTPGGTYVSLKRPPPQDEAAARGVRAVLALGPASQARFGEMTDLIGQGAISPVVSGVYRLDQAREAMAEVRAGHVRGKLVLRIAD